MFKIKIILLAACAAFLTTTASAILVLNVKLTPSLNSGTDSEGFVGSIWDFTWQFNQETYSDTFGLAAVVSDSASLTITGATNTAYNGTFTIVDKNTTEFLAVPNSEDLLFLGVNTVLNDSNFDFGAPLITVSNLSLVGNSIAMPAPAIGDPVLASHFDGALVEDISVDVSNGNYNFGSATVSAVPEPAIYAALFGFCVLGFAACRRRKAT